MVIIGQAIHKTSQAYFSEIEKLRSERDKLLADAEKQEKLLEKLRDNKTNLASQVKENEEFHQKWEKRMAEEPNSRKDVGRNVEVPMGSDDVPVIATLGALATSLNTLPKKFSEKTNQETREATACVSYSLACVKWNHPNIDIPQVIEGGLPDDKQEELVEEMSETGKSMANALYASPGSP
ncbi:hypothetical protein E2562_036900 [Oryza meyeriana var. granulata]|uniref:Uncharacterized protein n=1 Tax=Oryza meyeriana var. granulata TaxID=110450 RepID=A0A6G1ETH1_9ORYZ|nr:hypothetical protein E2562_036900 [Oryza meyeriana var. granulata]